MTTTTAPPATETCDQCHTDQPAGEFVPGLSIDFDGEHLCGVCRAQSIIGMSRHFGRGAANGIIGTLREATHLTRDANGVVVEKMWARDYYGLHAGWLYLLEVDSLAYAAGARVDFILAHLHECRPGPGALAWRAKR